MYSPCSRPMRSPAHLFGIAALCTAACSGAPYRVEVTLPAGVSGEQVAVRVLPGCGSNDVLSESVVTRGQAGMVLGALPRGTYGIEALVYDADCNLVAEGCVMVDATGAGGTVRVETSSADLRDCRGRDACVCTLEPPDAGPSDAGPDVGCTDCNDDGRCENLTTDRRHCGRCDNECRMGEMCEAGECI